MNLLKSIICLALFVAIATPTVAAGRVALVIGNAAYKHAAVLDNPVNDAHDIAAALEKQNFKVIKGIDLDHAGMLATIRRFSRALSKGDVGVFFYAGHGIQISGRNYLVPTDAKLADSFGIDFELVRLERIHQAMEQSAKVNIIFLDACRNNPMARNLARSMGTRSASVGNGLAAMESGIGSLISFSTQPGNVALDGRGMRNSPYSAALAKYISEGSGDITEILIKVRRDVMAATSRQQVPWEHSALTQQFYFAPKDKAPPRSARSNISKPDALTFDQRAELAYWNSVKDSGDATLLKSYLEQYPTGAFAALARVLLARAQQPNSQQKVAGEITPASKVAEGTKSAESEPASAVVRSEAQKRRERLLRLRASRRAAEKKTETAAETQPTTRKQVQVARLETSRNTQSATPSTSAGAPPTDPGSRIASYRAIQEELKRLKCYAGKSDGRWGSRSHVALRRAMGSENAPSVAGMKDLSAAASEMILTSLRELDAPHCQPQRASRTQPKAKPKSSISSTKRRKKKLREQRAKKRIKATRTTQKSKNKKKNCRTVFNEEALVDEKAPKIIRVCK